MSKIILINTLSYTDYWKDKKNNEKKGYSGIPLGLLSLGTELSKNGYSTKIIDPMVDENYLEIIRKESENVLWVGISAMTNGVASALEISKYIKQIDRDIPICWGGVHPTLFTESVARESSVDYVCWGEGERFVVEFSKYIEGKKELKTIEGIGYVKDNKYNYIPRNYFLDINEFALPKYDLINTDKYLYTNLKKFSYKANVKEGKIIAINTGIGCPFKCTFCWNNHQSQKYRIKNIDNLLANIDLVVKRFDPDVIHLQDDLFFANRKRFYRFLDEYDTRKYRFQWITNCRAEYFNDSYINDKVLERIEDKCIWLGIGIESGSDNVRKKLYKQLNSKQIYEAVESLGRHNMVVGYAFMTGLPYEKVEDTVQTIIMMKKIIKMNPSSRFAFQVFRPYPGSPLYEEAVEKGFDPPKNLDGWSIMQDNTNTGGVKREIIPWIDINDIQYFENLVIAVSAKYKIYKSTSKATYVWYFFMAILYKFSFNIRLLSHYWKNLSFESKLINTIKSILRKIYYYK